MITDGLLFEDFFSNQMISNPNMATDLIENHDNYKLYLELPGVEKKDVNITYKDSCLEITGEKTSKLDQKKSSYHLSERYSGSFKRAFKLPKAIKHQDISACFHHGVLEVTIPKTPEEKAKVISIT